MFANRFMASVIGAALGVMGAAAIAHSRAEIHINSSFSEAKPLDAECPKIEWPYGCQWRPEAGSRVKHLSMRSSNRKRFFRRMTVGSRDCGYYRRRTVCSSLHCLGVN